MKTLCAVGLMVLCLIWGLPASAGSTPAEKCQALKLKAASKNVACQTRAMVKAAGETADLAPCKERFARIFAKLELKGGCATVGDAPAIESQIDAVAGSLVTHLGGSCAARTCGDNGGACGIIPDGCGGTLDCGACDHSCSTDADCINTYHCWGGQCMAKAGDFEGCMGWNSCLSLCCCRFTDACHEDIDGAVHTSPGMCLEPELCPTQSDCPGGTASDVPSNDCGCTIF